MSKESQLNYNEKLIIANCSGFFGDRFSAAKEMVRGGPIHILTGDYLAELTMAILFRKTLKDPNAGYVSSFLKQMEEIMGECLDKKIKVIANAGGLNPQGLVKALEKVSDELGLKPKLACVEGDNLIARLEKLQASGESFTHIDKGIPLKDAKLDPVSANAYLGGWGITEALRMGADIVVTGRIADAALVSGPAAWKFNWKEDDWDKLAGAYAAGHVIECSTQATGGNYSFIEEVPSYKDIGFPIAEIRQDGSSIITKHPGTGGLVSVGTVTAQLLYEINSPAYLTPDVTARFDSINISQEGPDRVLISDIKGEPATDTLKVCVNNFAGHRNVMTVVLTGLDIEKKAKIVEENLFDILGGKSQFEIAETQLIRSDKYNPEKNEEAFAKLRIAVMGKDKEITGRLFSTKVVELVISSIPGFTITSPPTNGAPAIQHWPALISKKYVTQKIIFEGHETKIDFFQPDQPHAVTIKNPDTVKPPTGKTIHLPLGRIFAARSGDKGGNANIGVWAKTMEGYAFLQNFLTTAKLKRLLPDMSDYKIERYEFPNLFALNFYIIGVLGDGVAASFRSDPQGKTLGEYLRAKEIEIPETLLNHSS